MIHFNRVFHYMPSMLGCPYFWKHPFRDMSFYRSAYVFPMLGCEQFCASDANSRTVMVVARHLLENSETATVKLVGMIGDLKFHHFAVGRGT